MQVFFIYVIIISAAHELWLVPMLNSVLGFKCSLKYAYAKRNLLYGKYVSAFSSYEKLPLQSKRRGC